MNTNILESRAIDPFELTLVGMGIVFIGLVLIYFAVYYLPQFVSSFDNLLTFFKKIVEKKKEVPVEEEEREGDLKKEQERLEEESSIMMAIAIALNLDERDHTQRVTWDRYEEVNSPWKISGRVSQLVSHKIMRRG